MKRLKIKLLSVVMSLAMLLAIMPGHVFAQGETSVSNEEVVSSENLYFVKTTSPLNIQVRNSEKWMVEDIQNHLKK